MREVEAGGHRRWRSKGQLEARPPVLLPTDDEERLPMLPGWCLLLVDKVRTSNF